MRDEKLAVVVHRRRAGAEGQEVLDKVVKDAFEVIGLVRLTIRELIGGLGVEGGKDIRYLQPNMDAVVFDLCEYRPVLGEGYRAEVFELGYIRITFKVFEEVSFVHKVLIHCILGFIGPAFGEAFVITIPAEAGFHSQVRVTGGTQFRFIRLVAQVFVDHLSRYAGRQGWIAGEGVRIIHS